VATYCRECGKEEIKEWTRRYETKTGNKEYRYICPDKPCKHSTCNPINKEGFINRLFNRKICTRCGSVWCAD